MFTAWSGPILAFDVATLVDKQWAALMGTTITGRQYDKNGQPLTGKWGEAKALRNQIKQALS